MSIITDGRWFPWHPGNSPHPSLWTSVNRLGTTSGTVRIGMLQNSIGDGFLRRRAERAGSTNRADRTYDRTATNVVYTLLAATITEQ